MEYLEDPAARNDIIDAFLAEARPFGDPEPFVRAYVAGLPSAPLEVLDRQEQMLGLMGESATPPLIAALREAIEPGLTSDPGDWSVSSRPRQVADAFVRRHGERPQFQTFSRAIEGLSRAASIHGEARGLVRDLQRGRDSQRRRVGSAREFHLIRGWVHGEVESGFYTVGPGPNSPPSHVLVTVETGVAFTARGWFQAYASESAEPIEIRGLPVLAAAPPDVVERLQREQVEEARALESMEGGLSEAGNLMDDASRRWAEATSALRRQLLPLPPAEPVTAAALERGYGGWLALGDGALRTGEYRDAFAIRLRAGQRVAVDMESSDFDPYLILRSPGGEQWENDDHEGSRSRSRIERAAGEGGVWEVIATSDRPGEDGAYTLRVYLLP